MKIYFLVMVAGKIAHFIISMRVASSTAFVLESTLGLKNMAEI